MSHQTAFIITSVTTPFPAEPDHELVRLAVEEAGVTAVNAAIDALTSETDNSAAPKPWRSAAGSTGSSRETS